MKMTLDKITKANSMGDISICMPALCMKIVENKIAKFGDRHCTLQNIAKSSSSIISTVSKYARHVYMYDSCSDSI